MGIADLLAIEGKEHRIDRGEGQGGKEGRGESSRYDKKLLIIIYPRTAIVQVRMSGCFHESRQRVV